MPFVLAQDPDADELLGSSPLALLIGMLLDQQIPMEKAFRGPKALQERLGGSLDAATIASMDPLELEAAFSAKPAIHRFPAAMAKRTADLCRTVAEQYGNRAERIWTEAANGEDLFGRLAALPGFGPDKSRIFLALLGKQGGLQLRGWREASHPFGEPGTAMSVADIIDDETLAAVRAFKKEMKAAKAAGAK
ncbi:MAG: hypothetical protein M0Z34_09560 [Nitrospiraceae bacterium]|nr:hypothetical protein [Nitrospiraceae bacterium]